MPYTYPTNGVRPHAVTSAGSDAYTYDPNGNMLTGAGRSYTWNAENQPTQITSGTTTEAYAYDGNNARIKKTSTTSGSTTTTRYVGGGLVEYRSNGTVVSNYGVASRTTTGTPTTSNPGTLVYIHSDHLGSVSATSSGATGALVAAQSFDPWGAVRSGGVSSTEFNYTGQRKDAGTGLLFYNARYYDPALARFVQADSIVPKANSDTDEVGSDEKAALKPMTVDFHEKDFVEGVNKENAFTLKNGFWFQLSKQSKNHDDAKVPWGTQDAQSLSRYSYVNNNPLKYTDPTSHFKCGVISITINGRLASVLMSGSASAGISFDCDGNYAWVATPGYGGAIGWAAVIGGAISWVNAKTLTDTQGWSKQYGADIGPFSAEYIKGSGYHGFSVGAGTGPGGNIHVEKTYTFMSKSVNIPTRIRRIKAAPGQLERAIRRLYGVP